MGGFFVDEGPKSDTIPFGGAWVNATLTATGRLEIDFGDQDRGLLAVKAHVRMMRGLGINATPAPAPSVETKTEAPLGHLPGPAQRKPAAAAPPKAKAAPAPAPVVLGGPAASAAPKRGRGRPPKVKPATDEN